MPQVLFHNRVTSPNSNSMSFLLAWFRKFRKMDESDTTDSLHTIGSSEEDEFFDYHDPFIGSAILRAIMNYDLEKVKELVEAGMSVNINDNQGCAPLHLAISLHREAIFEYLITLDDIRLEAANFYGETPLIVSLVKEQPDWAKVLLSKGVSPLVGHDKDGNTALHLALILSNKDLFLELLEKGADIDAVNDDMETVLHKACDRQEVEFVSLILAYGPDMTIINYSEATAFLSALQRKDNQEIQSLLLDHHFEERVPMMDINFILEAITNESPLTEELIRRADDVDYDFSHLREWARALVLTESGILRKFAIKFRHFLEDLLCVTNALLDIFDWMRMCIRSKTGVDQGISNLLLLFELGFGDSLIEGCHGIDSLITSLCQITLRYLLDKEIINTLGLLLLVHGYKPSLKDMREVHVTWGQCLLWEVMMNVELTDRDVLDHYIYPELRLAYNLDLKVEDACVAEDNCLYLGNLLDYCILPVVIQAALNKINTKVKDKALCRVSRVPHLSDLARNAARSYIVDTFPGLKPHIYRSIVKRLPIANVHKEIILYERKLYK